MIKVLHVITDLGSGGAQSALLRLLRAMDGAAFGSAVATLTEGGAVAPAIRALGIPVFPLGMRRGRPTPAALARLVRLVHRFDPDLVQTWLYHADLLGLAAALPCHRPVLWNVRCSYMDLDRYPWLTRAVVGLLARLSGLPRAVVVNSGAGRRVHEELGYQPRRWVEIPNGFDTEEFRPDPAAGPTLRQELGLGPETLLIGYAARFDHMKDHRTFLRAAAVLERTCPEARFVLAGQGMDGSNTALAALIRDSGVVGRILLLGERHDMPRLTAGLDIATSASLGEGFPNVIGEAMACGVPVAATDVGDSAAILGGTGRIVPPRDPEALALAWGELAGLGPEGRAELGAAARSRIRETYSLASVVARYEELYGEVAGPCAG